MMDARAQKVIDLERQVAPACQAARDKTLGV